MLHIKHNQNPAAQRLKRQGFLKLFHRKQKHRKAKGRMPAADFERFSSVGV